MANTETQEIILCLLEPGKWGVGPGSEDSRRDLLSLQWTHALWKELPILGVPAWEAWLPVPGAVNLGEPLSSQSEKVKHGWEWMSGALCGLDSLREWGIILHKGIKWSSFVYHRRLCGKWASLVTPARMCLPVLMWSKVQDHRFPK